ncbi:MAG: hypothetical protein ACREQ5_00415 [Candidatus Dormibacteria bacterium]
MFDPLTILAAGGVATVAYVAGRIGRPVKAPKQPKLECSCGHGYGLHEENGACRGAFHRAAKWDSGGLPTYYEYAQCACRLYDGPEPLPRVWAL